ncbi:MAG: acyl-CoA synthetase [Chloroflexota bacterium]
MSGTPAREPQKSTYVPDWLQKRADLSGGRVAVKDAATGQQWTYAAWNRQVNRTANFLHHLGVRQGDRVAMYATNCMEYLDALFACNKTGAVLQNVNWRLTVPELEGVLNDAGPKVLIYSAEFVEQVNALRQRVPGILHFIALTQKADPHDGTFHQRDSLPDTWTGFPDLHDDSPWVICYTGGTTGLPKGAILTYGNITWNSVNAVMSVGLDQSDVYLLSMPLFHTGGLNIYTLPLFHVGGKVIITKAFDADEAMHLIAEEGVTVYLAVPTMYLMMQQSPNWDQADFSSIKAIFSGGAPCPSSIYEAFWAKGVDLFRVSYGLTEAGPYNIWMPDADIKRKPGAIGVPVMHAEVTIVNPHGVVVGPGEPGELLTRGPHITPGYWNRPDATRTAITDGWLHTGDLAVRDEEGYISVIGRAKDMIISGGENIYPAEIENVIQGHPAVAEVAVIGVPDEKWGEVGHAIIALKKGQSLTPDTIMAYMGERLAKYKIPRSVQFVEAIPKTAVGKIDKKMLAAQFGR